MTRAEPGIYVDAIGRQWPVEKLDAILADESAFDNVLAAASLGLNPNGTWSPGKVWTHAGIRYSRGRQETWALLLILVTRYFDTAGARYLGRRPWPRQIPARGGR